MSFALCTPRFLGAYYYDAPVSSSRRVCEGRQMCKVVQNLLDTGGNVLNIECQVVFGPPSMLSTCLLSIRNMYGNKEICLTPV
jgi:hypothetical protein